MSTARMAFWAAMLNGWTAVIAFAKVQQRFAQLRFFREASRDKRRAQRKS